MKKKENQKLILEANATIVKDLDIMPETVPKNVDQIPEGAITVEEDLEVDQEVIDIEEDIHILEVQDQEVIEDAEELEDIDPVVEVVEEEVQVILEVVDIEEEIEIEIVKEVKIDIKIRVAVIVEVITVLIEVKNPEVEVITVTKIEMIIKKMKRISRTGMKM